MKNLKNKSKCLTRTSYKLHRKDSIARAIQDYLLSKPYESIMGPDAGWCWLPLGKSKEYCLGLCWQDGYEGDEVDEELYGPFMDGTWVINCAIYFTNDFRINENYALYAETFFLEDGQDLMGGTSLMQSSLDDGFYAISKMMADEYCKFIRLDFSGKRRTDIK